MSKRIILDPVTRVSGALGVDVELENGIVTNSKASGFMIRGFEKMLEGRNPLDAIYYTQRICGICSTAHSIASATAIENLIGMEVEKNNMYIRDLIHGCDFLQNHIRHFYFYVMPDYINEPAVSPTSPFQHNDYRLPDEYKSTWEEHYNLAIKCSRLAHKMLAILGGKAPHNHGIFVGGTNSRVSKYDLIVFEENLDEIIAFVENYMRKDIEVISNYYSDYFNIGLSDKNFMSYGLFMNDDSEINYVNSQVYYNNKLENFDKGNIQIDRYKTWDSDVSSLDNTGEGKYSFVAAPRYNNVAMECGALARMYLSGNYRRGVSVMDRLNARVLETVKIVKIMKGILQRINVDNIKYEKFELPKEGVGMATIDTIRGALSHWVSIKNGNIENYRIITPSNWNISPMDSNGIHGPLESALIGTKIKDDLSPVELGRIIRSFDPCLSCATHVTTDKSESYSVLV